jgi:hypothetical protein
VWWRALGVGDRASELHHGVDVWGGEGSRKGFLEAFFGGLHHLSLISACMFGESLGRATFTNLVYGALGAVQVAIFHEIILDFAGLAKANPKQEDQIIVHNHEFPPANIEFRRFENFYSFLVFVFFVF